MENNVSDIALWDTMNYLPEEGGDVEISHTHTTKWAIYITEEIMLYPIVIVGLLSNLWMIYYLIKVAELHIVEKAYLVSRALADMLYLYNLPLSIIRRTTENWSYGTFTCQLFYAVFSTQPFIPSVLVAIMSVDFLIARRFPVIAKKWRTSCTAIVVSLIVWTLTTLYVAPIVAEVQVETSEENENHCVTWWPTTPNNKLLYSLFIGYVIPLGIVFIITGFLLFTRDFKTSNGDDMEMGNRMQECIEPSDEGLTTSTIKETSFFKQTSGMPCYKENLIYGTLVVSMSLLVFVCWLPFFVLEIYVLYVFEYTMPLPNTVFRISPYVDFLPRLLPALNPILVLLLCSRINWIQSLLHYFSFPAAGCAQTEPTKKETRN